MIEFWNSFQYDLSIRKSSYSQTHREVHFLALCLHLQWFRACFIMVNQIGNFSIAMFQFRLRSPSHFFVLKLMASFSKEETRKQYVMCCFIFHLKHGKYARKTFCILIVLLRCKLFFNLIKNHEQPLCKTHSIQIWTQSKCMMKFSLNRSGR